jgi:hypothetical protein
MSRDELRHLKALSVSFVLSLAAMGCSPTVNVLGTYFPSPLVCGAIGLFTSYAVVRALATHPPLRPLAQSLLLFLSITVLSGFVAWWSLFSAF